MMMMIKLLWRKRRKRYFDHPCYLPFGVSWIGESQWLYWSDAGISWVVISRTDFIHEWGKTFCTILMCHLCHPYVESVNTLPDNTRNQQQGLPVACHAPSSSAVRSLFIVNLELSTTKVAFHWTDKGWTDAILWGLGGFNRWWIIVSAG